MNLLAGSWLFIFFKTIMGIVWNIFFVGKLRLAY